MRNHFICIIFPRFIILDIAFAAALLCLYSNIFHHFLQVQLSLASGKYLHYNKTKGYRKGWYG